MQETFSIKKNIIRFDPNSLNKSIEEILACRFEKDDFKEKTLDDLHNPYLFKDMKKADLPLK